MSDLFLNPAYKMDPSLQKHNFPRVEHSEGIRPAGEYYIAPWLPTADGVEDKHLLDYAVITPGKIVALTRDGYVCPAGYLKKWKALADGDTALVYTQTDYDLKVMDLTTGAKLTGTQSYTKAQVATALKSQKLLGTNETLDKFISNPVGVAPYAYYNAFNHSRSKQKSLRNPKNDRFYNYDLQNNIAILCDYVLELPLVPEQAAVQTGSNLGTAVAVTSQTGLWYMDLIQATDFYPLAGDTEMVPWIFSNTTQFARRVTSTRGIKSTGDYLVDEDNSRIYLYHLGAAAALDGLLETSVFQLRHYNSTSDSFVPTNYACVVGAAKPGDYLIPTSKSNWIPATKLSAHYAPTSTVGTAFDQAELQGLFDEVTTIVEEESQVIGQVLEIVHHPRSSAEKVHSFGGHLDATGNYYRDRIPGSSTGGMPQEVSFSKATNKTVVVNIIRK